MRFLHFFFLSYGYIIIQMAMTPVRIRLLNTILDKVEYGVLNLVIMSVSFLAVFLSLGSFEFLVRRLPGTEAEYQERAYGLLVRTFLPLGLLVALVGAPLLLLLRKAGEASEVIALRDFAMHLDPGDAVACGIALVLYLFLQFRMYYFLGCANLLRFRICQFLYLDGWFFVLLGVAMFVKPLGVSTVLWTWCSWLFVVVIFTNRWAPLRLGFRATPRADEALSEDLPPLSLRHVLVFSLPLLPMIFGDWLFRISDRFFVVAHSGLERFADYNLCMNIALMIFLVGCNLIGVILPEFNRLVNKLQPGDIPHRNEGLTHIVSIMTRYALALVLPGCLALYLLHYEVMWVLGDTKYHAASPLIQWAAPASAFFLLYIVFSRVLIALERSREVGLITLGCALLNIALNALLISTSGRPAEAAAVATCISLFALFAWTAASMEAWKWIRLSSLKPWRILFATICCLALDLLIAGWVEGISVSIRGLDVRPLVTLLICGTGNLAFLLGFGLFPKSELLLLFAGADDEESAQTA